MIKSASKLFLVRRNHECEKGHKTDIAVTRADVREEKLAKQNFTVKISKYIYASRQIVPSYSLGF